MKILAAYIREKSYIKENTVTKDYELQEKDKPLSTDFQVILDLIYKREHSLNGKLDLQNSNLPNARLYASNLEGAQFRKAHIEKADLQGAHLEGAFLTGAHLEGANLTGANLEEANLEGAENLTVDQLSKAKTLYKAQLDEELEAELRAKGFGHLLDNEPKE